MNILITGAGGVLGRALTARLESDDGVHLRLTDMVPFATRYDFRQADLTKPADLAPVCAGIDVLVHIAGVIPTPDRPAEHYFRCNAQGSWNIIQAAAQAGVRRVVCTGSVASMGMSRTPMTPLPWDETKACEFEPGDVYGFTKHVGEVACMTHAAKGGFDYVIIRPGMFTPAPEADPSFGLGLLNFTVHADDVVQAHRLAIHSRVVNEAFVIASKTAFIAADGPELLQDAAAVVRRRYPLARRLEEQGIALPSSIQCTYDIRKAQRMLGYEPTVTFQSWLERRFGHGA